MGNYLNPGNEGFRQAVRSEIYVDKTGLLKFTNRVLGADGNCIAVSHARRFGKSQAARMIESYYSRGCDSGSLFEPFEIAKEKNWDRHLNKFNVIHLDMATLVNTYKLELVSSLKKLICSELTEEFPDTATELETDGAVLPRSLPSILNDIYIKSGSQFVIIIDEWDSIIRNYAEDKKFIHEYMQFLHDIFKSEESLSFLALGYITGILPLKKIEDESALNNFREYTMINSRQITEYYGFTGDEVKDLCERYGMDPDMVKLWYDGYTINGHEIYNPNSVVQAMQNGACEAYWKNTSSFKTINTCISSNFEGLKDDILKMLAGGTVYVNTGSFQNDLSEIRNKNEALTALIHFGYLAYDTASGEARIPNYEVSLAYQAALTDSRWNEVAKSIETAQAALNAMLAGRSEEFAEFIDLAHEAYTSIKNYNDENALYSVLYMALFTARAYYNVERELPGGKGFADMVLLPRKDAGGKPIVVLELKYDKSADAAIRQIKEKRYAKKLTGYAGKVLLVGVNYDKDSKKHECIIEEMPASF